MICIDRYSWEAKQIRTEQEASDEATKEAIERWNRRASNPAPVEQAAPDQRTRFETAHCGGNKHTCRRNEHGDYVLPSVQDAWAGWQSCSSQAAPVTVPQKPLTVFDKGPWIWAETGENFSGADLDNAAFHEYQRHMLAAAPAAPSADAQWISVEDRLPERETQKVIVFCKMIYSPSYLHVGVYSDGKWDVDDSRVNGITGYVSHWMPLPDVPAALSAQQKEGGGK